MESVMFVLLLVVGVLIVSGGIIAMQQGTRRKHSETINEEQEAWSMAARALGLEAHPDGSLISGLYQGRQVTVMAVESEERENDNRRTYEVDTFFPAPLPGKIRIAPRTMLHGANRFNTGHEAFDERFQLIGDPEILGRLLSAPVRDALLRYVGNHPEMRLTPEGVNWSSKRTSLKSAQDVTNALDAQAALVEAAWDAAIELGAHEERLSLPSRRDAAIHPDLETTDDEQVHEQPADVVTTK